MDNNTIPQDEMDRLLRETFVNSPDTETDKMADMMSKHVYGNHWGVLPPVDKAQHFAAKKLLFKGISLNTIIGTGIAVAGVMAATGIYLALPTKSKEVAESRQKIEQPTEPKNDDMLADSSVQAEPEKPAMALSPKRPVRNHMSLPPEAYNSNGDGETVAEDVPQTPEVPIAKTPYVNGSGSKPEEAKPLRYRYMIIPDISNMEALANEKRKQEMIRQVQRGDKREWAFIPMGTTHINGDAVSVQAFFMQTHEVTNLQYRTFLYDLVLDDKLREYEKAAVYDSAWIIKSGLAPFVQDYFWNPLYDQYPVVNITYEGAKMYCDWLTRLVNYNNKLKGTNPINDIRVPSTAEWIYAAKADHDTAIYAWKGIYLRNSKGVFQANFQSGRGLNDHDGADVTAPVLSYFPNDFGLYNMCGNVAEMTRPVENEMNLKGGAWNTKADEMKISTDNIVPLMQLPTTNVGFRPVFTYTGDY